MVLWNMAAKYYSIFIETGPISTAGGCMPG